MSVTQGWKDYVAQHGSASHGFSFGSLLPILGTAANFIPGVGPLVGAGLTAAGGLLSANQAQHQADLARQSQSDYLNYIRGNLESALASAGQDPYAPAGPYDQYSPAWNAAATGAFRDDTAQALQGQLAGIDYNLRPVGGIRSSAMEYAKAQALRDASAQNAAFMRNLRIQGGVERYNNMVKASDEKFRRQQSILAMQSGLGPEYQQMYANAQGNANAIQGGLAEAVKALSQIGLGTGARGGKTGNIRGDNTMNTGYQPGQNTSLGPTGVRYNPLQTYEGYAGPGTVDFGTRIPRTPSYL